LTPAGNLRFESQPAPPQEAAVIILGLILLVCGYLIGIGVLVTFGWILIAVGLLLLILGAVGHPVGGRPYWF